MTLQQDERPVDVRQKIIEEATRLFGEHGYGATSLANIADAVGIRKPSLLYHFPSKVELRRAVNRELVGHWKEELPRLLSGTSSGMDRFSSTIEALVNFFIEDTSRAKLAIREMLDDPQESRKIVQEDLRPWTKLMVDFIRMGQQTGVIKPEVDPESYIIQVMMMVIGTVALGGVASALIVNGDDSLEPKIRELVRIARDTLFVHPEQETR